MSTRVFDHLLLADFSPLVPLAFTTLAQTGDADTLYLQGKFEQELPEYETLWLYAEITVDIGGQRFHYNQRGTTPAMFRWPGSDWFSFPSPGLAVG